MEAFLCLCNFLSCLTVPVLTDLIETGTDVFVKRLAPAFANESVFGAFLGDRDGFSVVILGDSILSLPEAVSGTCFADEGFGFLKLGAAACKPTGFNVFLCVLPSIDLVDFLIEPIDFKLNFLAM